MSKPGPNSPHLVNVIFPTRGVRSKSLWHVWADKLCRSCRRIIHITTMFRQNGRHGAVWSRCFAHLFSLLYSRALSTHKETPHGPEAWWELLFIILQLLEIYKAWCKMLRFSSSHNCEIVGRPIFLYGTAARLSSHRSPLRWSRNLPDRLSLP